MTSVENWGSLEYNVCTEVHVDLRDDQRNPLIIPEKEEVKKGCPKCGHEKFNGRKVQGAVTFTCDKCKNQWQGGLPQELIDPRIPMPPENPIPPNVTFSKNSKTQEIQEHLRRPNLATDFRKGAPIPEDGEEDA